MNRYFFYLVFLNMLVNVIIFVPKILLNERYEGAVMATLLAIPIGMTFILLFNKFLSKFPQQGLPEILDCQLSQGWLKKIVLLIFSMVWFVAGAITIVAYVNISKRFMNPDASKFSIVLIFICALVYVIRFQSDKILYFLEILLIVNVPIVLFIFIKSMTSVFCKQKMQKVAEKNT